MRKDIVLLIIILTLIFYFEFLIIGQNFYDTIFPIYMKYEVREKNVLNNTISISPNSYFSYNIQLNDVASVSRSNLNLTGNFYVLNNSEIFVFIFTPTMFNNWLRGSSYNVGKATAIYNSSYVREGSFNIEIPLSYALGQNSKYIFVVYNPSPQTLYVSIKLELKYVELQFYSHI